MLAWLSAIIAAVWKVIQPFIAPAAAAGVGAKLQEGAQAKDSLERIYEADEAVAAARGWSPADRLRHLERRGRLRDIP